MPSHLCLCLAALLAAMASAALAQGGLPAPAAPEAIPTQITPSKPPARVDPPLDAEAFDRLTQGKTMDTHDAKTGLYGIERFLPGRRVIWADAEGCTHGTWAQVGEQICFDYDSQPGRSICWSYHDRGAWIMGWFEGDRQNVPIMLYPSKDGLSCEDYTGV